MKADSELETMRQIDEVLNTLDAEPRKRVVAWIVQKHGGGEASQAQETRRHSVRHKPVAPSPSAEHHEKSRARIREIVKQVRTIDDAQRIERYILDSTNQVNRALLPLFIVQKYMNDEFALSAAEIAEVTKLLNVPMKQENVSKALRNGGAKFTTIEGETPKTFKLIRRGVQLIESLLIPKSQDSDNAHQTEPSAQVA
jgi:hypothetical protein